MRFNPNSTWVTLGAAGSAIGFAVICTWIVSNQLSDINRQFSAMQARMDSLEDSIGDRFTVAKASEVALRTAIENPGMRVPDPRNPSEIIEVRGMAPHRSSP